MMLTNSVQLEQLQLFSESFPQALGMCLWKFLNILTEGHSWDHTLMLDEKTWLTVSALIPKVLSIWGQDSALPSPALRHQHGPAFVPTAFELIWRLHDFWRSVVIDSTEDRWPLHTMHVTCTLHGLPIYSVIIPLGADCRVLSTEELVVSVRWRYHTVIHWAPQSSSFFHKCLQNLPECLGAWSDWKT